MEKEFAFLPITCKGDAGLGEGGGGKPVGSGEGYPVKREGGEVDLGPSYCTIAIWGVKGERRWILEPIKTILRDAAPVVCAL